jgi:hypothetical protein
VFFSLQCPGVDNCASLSQGVKRIKEQYRYSKGDETKIMNRVLKVFTFIIYPFSLSVLERAEDSLYAVCVVTGCLLFMNTASGSDRILEQNCHDLNSFRPENLHTSC